MPMAGEKGYNLRIFESGDFDVLTVSQVMAVRDDRTLFECLSFSVSPGDIVQITGPNGAGKTTLLKALIGSFSLQEGQIFWHDKNITEDDSIFFAEMLYWGHQSGLKAALTASENLKWLAQVQGKSLSQAEISQALQCVRLLGYENVRVDQMSAGQKRRVALARFYALSRSLWILDEPFTALDQQAVIDVEAMLLAHVQLGGMVVMTTHHPLSGSVPVRRINLAEFSA